MAVSKEDRHWSYDPLVPDPELEPGEQYDVVEEQGPPPEEVGVGKKKKTKRGEVEPKYRDRILERDPSEEADAKNWWKFPSKVAGVGVAFIALTMIGVAASIGPLTGLLVGFGVIFATAVQATFLVFLLMMVGEALGISYGSIMEAIAKLAAITLLLNGLNAVTISFGLVAVFPCGVVGWIVFMYLFRLEFFEQTFTYGFVVASSTVLKLIALFVVERKLSGN